MDAGLLWTAIGSAAAVPAAVVGAWQLRLQMLEHRKRRRSGELENQLQPVPGALSVAPPVGRLPFQVRGRDVLLAELRRSLVQRKPQGGTWVLAGMGGLGKSTVALAVADAALLHPMPEQTDKGDDAYQAMAEAAWQEREELAEQLRLSWQEGGIDPLLSTLARLHEQRLQLEADMRLLMAYGRCFTHPRPYKLIDLARAAGLSISGVRIAFTDDEITQAAEILRRPPVSDDRLAAAPQ